MIIVVMGVSGCGKTTIGKLLSQRLGLAFYDADDFHSRENIRKMSHGIPLTDEDRMPWLAELAALLKSQEEEGAVLACSALKENYRLLLQEGLKERIIWIHLEGTQELLQERLEKRAGHFLSAKLLASQLEALERPAYAYHFPITESPETIVEEIVRKVRDR